MQNSGLSTKTNLRLIRQYRLFFVLRIAGMGFATVGLLFLLPFLVRAQMPLHWKIVSSAVACGLASLSVYFGVRFSRYRYSEFRFRVVWRTSEEDLLEEMAQLDADKFIRAVAADRLKNQTLLEKIALRDPDACVREAAVKRLKNQGQLVEIALRDTDYKIRKIVAGLVVEDAFVEKLLREATDEALILTCAFHVYKKYKNDDAFPENFGRALKQNAHAVRILDEPRCPKCFHSGIRFFHETRTESICVLGCGDSIQYVNSDYEYNAHQCDHCGLDSESDTPVTLANYC